ncbi:MAG: T9SS type A sorting domain-containing protein [Bacteroidales bacterium]|nr:T9SS type A sorting domain-containing protein [Bacteroidota bacterium]MBL6949564.1 T9SS type A sorting domain-containing protein [Bacteroidales bacterium]
MKKLLLSVYLLSMVAFFGYSQSLSLDHEGTPVPNNGNVIYPGEPSSALIEAHIGVTNNSAATLDVMCKKVEISLIPGSNNTFCWGGLCYDTLIYVSLDPEVIAPGETNTMFIGEYKPKEHAGETIIRYVFFDRSNANDSVCFQSLYQAYPLGIEDQKGLAALSKAYPNPATTQTSFNYVVETGAHATLVVRNVLGSTVKEVLLAGSGVARISTLDLSEGIYFYSLVMNGQIKSTRKLVVSH